LESHQSGGGIAYNNGRAFEGVARSPSERLGKYYKMKNKKVYVVFYAHFNYTTDKTYLQGNARISP
jgi:hypothetical protein